MSSTITINLPAPESAQERAEARSVGRSVNPAFGTDWDLDPDSPLIDALLLLSRALWAGEAATITLPLALDTDAERAALNELADHIGPGTNLHLEDTGVGAVLADAFYAIRGALAGVSAEVARTHRLLGDTLHGVCFLANVVDTNRHDQPIMWEYRSALLDGEDRTGEITELREKFRRAVQDAERAMDLADRLLAERRHA